jgi:HNH endonuclease
MPSATRKTKSSQDAYCPHCHLLIEKQVVSDWPPAPLQCPHCRLLVGVGRARPTPVAEPGARGSAAGVFAHEAKRTEGEAEASSDEVCEAIRRVADELGSRPERLLMVDYQQRASGDDSLPALRDVFASFGSWKRARRAAAATG